MSENKIEIPEGFPEALGTFIIVDVSHVTRDKPKETTTEGGIVIPKFVNSETQEQADNKSIPRTGVIVSAGPKCTVLKKGYRIVLPLNVNGMVHFDYDEKPKDKKYVMMKEEIVPAVFGE